MRNRSFDPSVPLAVRARYKPVITADAPLPGDRIGPGDEMFAGNLEHYMGVGESAMRSILAALRAAGHKRCGAILDLPSGHGRVLGLLQTRPELSVISYAEATWDMHYDVVACIRRSEPFVTAVCPPVFRSEAPTSPEPTPVEHC